MSESRHEFILTARDGTKVAFDSAKAGFIGMQRVAISASSAIAVGLGGVGVVAFTKNMAEMGEEALLSADRLNTTTEQITSLQYAASKFGVDGESMNSVLQDMSVRIQEFATIGTGEAADFFEGLNLDVKEFEGLAPDQLLYRVAQELENVSDASARVYLDQLGSDNLVSLLPALRNGAEGLRSLQDEAYATNKVLKEADAIKLASIANEINTMENSAKALSQQLAAEFEPAVKVISERFNEFASDGDAVTNTLDTVATAGTLVATVYAGKMAGAFVTSAQAKYADTMATRANAAANVAEAEAVQSKAQIKLTEEAAAYKATIAAKTADAVASEKLAAENLLLAKSAQAAAAADMEAAVASKAHAEQLSHTKLRAEKLKAAESELAASKSRLATTTARAEKAEQAHQAQIAKNAASIQVATDNTKKLDKAKSNLENSTKKLSAAQKAHNATMRAGSIAARGLSGALGLVGGPIGLLFTGVTALSLLQSSASGAAEEVGLLGLSTEELNKKLAKSSYQGLNESLDQVNEKIAIAKAQVAGTESKIDNSPNLIGHSKKNINTTLRAQKQKEQELTELSSKIKTQIEIRDTRVAKVQADQRLIISTQALKTSIENIQKSANTAEQIRLANYEKQIADIKTAEEQQLLTVSEASDLRYKIKASYDLKEEQLELASRQKRMSAFSDNYTQREQMTIEHQQRVLQYMQDNGITNDQNEEVVAYQKESYEYQLQLFKEFQDGILSGYNDYGKTAVQKEKDRYKEELDLLKKHLKDKSISQEQYDSAKAVADERAAKNRKDAEMADLNASLNSQKEFADLFVGMADSKNKTLASMGKSAAMYNIGIQTAQGVMSAWSTSMQLGPIAGPIVGGILSGAMIAYGVEQMDNVRSQTYHTGGIAGKNSDNYSAMLAANEVPATLIRGEEVLTETDPRHRNNLSLSKGSSSESVSGSVVNQITIGEVSVTVDAGNASTSAAIGQSAGNEIATQVVAVLQSKIGQKLVYSGVSAEAGRNGGKIKGVR